MRRDCGRESRCLGKAGSLQKRRITSGLPEAIPPAFFANPEQHDFADGWATGLGSASDGPDWGDLRFERDEVFRLMNGMQSQPRALRRRSCSTDYRTTNCRPANRVKKLARCGNEACTKCAPVKG